MVVTALGLLLGARADAGAVRSGAKQAWVEGRWLVPDDGAIAERVAETGGDVEGGELLLGRSVSSEGRSRAVVGGRSAPVGVLGELGDELVVVHGQADQQRLRSAAAQRDALDRFAGAPLQRALGEYRAAFTRLASGCRGARSACARRTTPAPARPTSCARRSTRSRPPIRSPVKTSSSPNAPTGSRNLEELRLAAAQAQGARLGRGPRRRRSRRGRARRQRAPAPRPRRRARRRARADRRGAAERRLPARGCRDRALRLPRRPRRRRRARARDRAGAPRRSSRRSSAGTAAPSTRCSSSGAPAGSGSSSSTATTSASRASRHPSRRSRPRSTGSPAGSPSCAPTPQRASPTRSPPSSRPSRCPTPASP